MVSKRMLMGTMLVLVAIAFAAPQQAAPVAEKKTPGETISEGTNGEKASFVGSSVGGEESEEAGAPQRLISKRRLFGSGKKSKPKAAAAPKGKKATPKAAAAPKKTVKAAPKKKGSAPKPTAKSPKKKAAPKKKKKEVINKEAFESVQTEKEIQARSEEEVDPTPQPVPVVAASTPEAAATAVMGFFVGAVLIALP